MEKRKKGLEDIYNKYDSEMNGFYHIDMTPVSGVTSAVVSSTSSHTSTPPQQLKTDKEELELGLLTVSWFFKLENNILPKGSSPNFASREE